MKNWKENILSRLRKIKYLSKIICFFFLTCCNTSNDSFRLPINDKPINMEIISVKSNAYDDNVKVAFKFLGPLSFSYNHQYGTSIDSACVWGKTLTALCVEGNNTFSVEINKKDLN